jgi:hypothetical protein
VIVVVAVGAALAIAVTRGGGPPAGRTHHSSSASSQPPAGVGNCAAAPSRCGFPDGSTTGVPAGVALKDVPGQVSKGAGWHWDSRGWVEVDGNGATFSGYRVQANIDVTADNVTISNNLINTGGDGFGISLRHTSNVTIAHNTITSPSAGSDRLMVGIKTIYGDETGTTVLGNDISHTATGVQIDAGLIQDNYIHAMGYKPGDHVNGTTSNSGQAPLTIRHNTILNQVDQTDAVSLFEDFGTQHDRVIDNNLLAGGGYTIYGGANPGGAQTSNIKITNNRISTIYYPHGGYYGPVTAYDPHAPGNTWTGNVWDETSQACCGA